MILFTHEWEPTRLVCKNRGCPKEEAEFNGTTCAEYIKRMLVEVAIRYQEAMKS